MPNHLAKETSPYLQQHANNPVDWMPWSEQALALAREQNKPILLSIGYSACHWCHVMAHESFEDPAVAEIMNRLFVNIKVDREERPDLDHIYQAAHNLLARRNGGWPLTMFLTPDQKPFFGGTYFPKEPRYNLPGFPGLLERVAEFYHSNHDEINKQNASLIEALTSNQTTVVDTGHLLEAPLDDAIQQFGRTFDQIHGGFGGAPKFPRASDMEFLLAQGKQHHDHEMTSTDMTLFTLAKMAEGGIFDQLGGGFCRYSVDEKWVIPHFEKMLYDNGPLLGLYADTFALTDDKLFRHTVEETAAWTIREMQSPEGGYYSALDADSEHEEGKFYVWAPDEVASLLTTEEYGVAAPYYGFNRPPNFENRHWHLIVAGSLESIARTLQISPEEAKSRLASARQKLFAAREKRVRPGRDEKILVSWNALMIKGMAHAGRRLNRPEWIASARKALEFIHSQMWKDGRLLATYKDGKAHLNAYLDDYAFLLDALLELLQADFRVEELTFAQEVADVMLAQFEDVENGGFFFTSHDHEKLISRPKSGYDNAIPSGNGIAALTLQRLGHLSGDQRYLTSSLKTLKFFYPAIKSQAFAFASLLMTLSEYLAPPQIVILRGPDQEMAGWQQALAKIYLPSTLILGIPSGIKGLPQSLNKPGSDKVNAWVCQGVKCLPAIDNLDALVETLGHIPDIS